MRRSVLTLFLRFLGGIGRAKCKEWVNEDVVCGKNASIFQREVPKNIVTSPIAVRMVISGNNKAFRIRMTIKEGSTDGIIYKQTAGEKGQRTLLKRNLILSGINY